MMFDAIQRHEKERPVRIRFMLFCRNQDFATASAEMMISKDNRIRYNNSAESSSYISAAAQSVP
jgi:hypothetical protein